MKQMTKEELIEYFIEQLGDNEILGQVITIGQIREKLDIIIEHVTYNEEEGNIVGSWNPLTRTINFDTRKKLLIREKGVIVHELLHALSTKIKIYEPSKIMIAMYGDLADSPMTIKCGLQFSEYIDKDYWAPIIDSVKNTSINEGITDLLAERITKVRNNYSYKTEKDIYKILSVIIGEDTILRKYFSEEISQEKSPEDIFREELIKKYGETLGEDINCDVKKVLILSDQLFNLDRNDELSLLNEYGKTLKGKTTKEIYATLESIIGKLLENTSDITTTINEVTIPLFYTGLDDKIFDLFVKSGQISNEPVFKRNAFYRIAHSRTSQKDMLDLFKKTKYRQIGEYYDVIDYRELYDKKGNQIIRYEEMYDSYLEGEELDSRFLDRINQDFPNINMEELQKKIKEKYTQYQDSMSGKGLEFYEYDMAVSVGKNIIRINYTGGRAGETVFPRDEFFLVNTDGSIEYIEPRGRTKIYR